MDFQITKNYPCSYLPGRLARSRVVLTSNVSDADAYTQLIRQGYRRSGNFIYRPDCELCHACIPARIPAELFHPNRIQRRIWKRHQHLQATRHPLHFDPAHFDLYQRYQKLRHPGGGMDLDDQNGHEQYCNFLLQSMVDSFLVTFHENQQLRMVSIIDQLPDGLSSVYTFFDPDVTGTSYGTFNILWQIAQCHHGQLPYLYLGYWIENNRKMRYKANFQPLQLLVDNQWQCQETCTTI
ncbi:arginyltransferase [Nitrosomonas eutropha]|uniref:Aspartate/glutamate leucyltransferase n=2 Tax=Nitrosomonas eutropha TaxID=916 RepID=A0ABX5M609_9PROT|nr:arginyltransferase [Nitrosomonas eutropha]ABI58919.1 Arginyltransferase [Nitrosomonas eutropha C91]PXV77266.1 arginine-tRNA-protein transferase [Nitrosomonas eutropha]